MSAGNENEGDQKGGGGFLSLMMNKLNFDSETTIANVAETFRLLCEYTLPANDNVDSTQTPKDFDPQLFSTVLTKVGMVFRSCVDDLRQSDPHPERRYLSHQDRESCLNALIVISDCLELCATRVPSNTSTEHASKLIETVLQTALNTFLLYRDFNVNESDLSKQFLDSHFNKAISLTKAFVALWDKLKVNGTFENDVQLVLRVCDYLYDICQAFKDITGKPAVSLWKCYTSTLLKHRDNIQDRVDVAKVIKCLCKEISIILREIDKQSVDDIARSAQLCGFFCKILKTVCDRFKNYLGDCFTDLMQLILTLYGQSARECDSPESTESVVVLSEIEKRVTVVVEPLTIQLLNETGFLDILTETAVDGDQPFPTCLLLLFVMQALPNLEDEQQNILIDPNKKSRQERQSRISVFDKLFDTFPKCTEFAAIVFASQAQRNHVWRKTRKTCELLRIHVHESERGIDRTSVATFSPPCTTERTLLRSLTCGTMWQALLACDAWSYLGRLESPKLCYQHFCVLASVVDRLDPIPVTAGSTVCVRLLCRRLFHFLAKEHKLAFVADFPVDRHPRLWLCILLCVSDELFVRLVGGKQCLITRNILVLEQSVIKESNSRSPSSEVLKQMYYSLLFLCRAYSDDDSLPYSLKSRLLKATLNLWLAIDVECARSCPNAELVICALIPLLGKLLSWSTNSILMQILPKMVRVQQVGGDAVKLIVSTTFVPRLGKKQVIVSGLDQTEILSCFSAVLSGGLRRQLNDGDDVGSALVLHHSLEAFSAFSHVTPHGNVISRCFVQRPDIKEIVIRFLKQVPIRSRTNCDYETLIRNQCKHAKENGIQTKENDDVPICRPPEKRAKLHENEANEKLYRAAVEGISDEVAKLRTLLHSTETENPTWLSSEIDVILRELTTVKNTVN